MSRMVRKLGLNGDLRNDWRKRTMTNDTGPVRGTDGILREVAANEDLTGNSGRTPQYGMQPTE
jgi:hypothetical protein